MFSSFFVTFCFSILILFSSGGLVAVLFSLLSIKAKTLPLETLSPILTFKEDIFIADSKNTWKLDI